MSTRPGIRAKVTVLAFLLLQAACLPLARQDDSARAALPPTDATPTAGAKVDETQSLRPPPETGNATTVRLPQRPLIRELGTDRYVGKERRAAHSPGITASRDETGDADGDSAETGMVLNFQQTDLREFVKAILGDVLELNYLIDPQVGGEVTIETTRTLPRKQLFALVEEVLALNGAAIVRKGELYEILPRALAVAGRLAPTTRAGDDTGHAVRLIPLQYTAATELQEIIKPFASTENQLRIDTERNLLILSGSREELDIMEETIRLFDVDWMKGKSIGLYPLNHVSPRDMEQDLRAILGDAAGGSSMLKGLLRTVTIARLNSILLIGTTTAALREGELWLYRLDRPGQHVGRSLYVYPVQNAKAVELAEILNQVFAAAHAQRPEDTPAALAPGTQPVRITGDEAAEESPRRAETTRRSQAVPAGAGVALPATDSIEIIADDTRNALVILAEPQNYRMVEAAIRKLDIVPLQVLIQAGIVEVTLTDEFNFGVEWFFRNALGDDHEGRLQLDLDDAAGINFGVPSISYSIVNNADQVRLALSALAGETEVNVLSTPSLMVLDNQTARINVGDEIPVPTRQSISNVDSAAPTVNEIEFRKTGVTLVVTPRVNNSGLVTMEIKQSVSDAVQTLSSGLDAPTIQQRELESTIAVNSGETLVLGGLIRDRSEQRNSGVPGLRKIPLIGKLFSDTSEQKRRTELLVLITPRVSRNREDARGITEELKRQLRSIQPDLYDPS